MSVHCAPSDRTQAQVVRTEAITAEHAVIACLEALWRGHRQAAALIDVLDGFVAAHPHWLRFAPPAPAPPPRRSPLARWVRLGTAEARASPNPA